MILMFSLEDFKLESSLVRLTALGTGGVCGAPETLYPNSDAYSVRSYAYQCINGRLP
jgi:hypothetical protein